MFDLHPFPLIHQREFTSLVTTGNNTLLVRTNTGYNRIINSDSNTHILITIIIFFFCLVPISISIIKSSLQEDFCCFLHSRFSFSLPQTLAFHLWNPSFFHRLIRNQFSISNTKPLYTMYIPGVLMKIISK